MLLEPLFRAHKQKDAVDSWIPTPEMSVLHDRVHSLCLSRGMASATGECQELSSGNTAFSHDLRSINCGVDLERNPRRGYQLNWVYMTKLLLVGVLQVLPLWEDVEDSSLSNRASAVQPQDGPTAGQGWAHPR